MKIHTLISSFFFASASFTAFNLSSCAFAIYSVRADGSRKSGVEALRTLCEVFCAMKANDPEENRTVESAMREIFMTEVANFWKLSSNESEFC